MPADERASDLMHWQTMLVSGDVAAVAQRLRGAGYRFVSPELVELPDSSLGFRRAVLVRDPDGHVMQVVER